MKNTKNQGRWVRHEESHSDGEEPQVSWTSSLFPGWRILERTVNLGHGNGYTVYLLHMDGTQSVRDLNANNLMSAQRNAESWITGRTKKGRGGTML